MRKDGRGLGQVEGNAAPAALEAAVPAPTAGRRSYEPAATTGVHAQARPVLPIEDDEPTPAYHEAVRAQGQNAQTGHVPAFISTNPETLPATGQLEVPRIFDEEPARRRVDDLDIPDFLK